MAKSDTQYLKEYVDKRQLRQMAGTETAETIAEDSSQFLYHITEDSTQAQKRKADEIRLRQLQKRADAREAANAEREQQKAQRDAQKAQEDEEKARVQESQHFQDRVSQVVDAASSTVGPTADRIGSLRTPGGIGLLLVILVVLLFTVVRVNSNGDTRLKQLWYMLNGRATIVGRQSPSPNVQSSGSSQSGSNFGGQPGFSFTTPTSTVTTLADTQYRALTQEF